MGRTEIRGKEEEVKKKGERYNNRKEGRREGGKAKEGEKEREKRQLKRWNEGEKEKGLTFKPYTKYQRRYLGNFKNASVILLSAVIKSKLKQLRWILKTYFAKLQLSRNHSSSEL